MSELLKIAKENGAYIFKVANEDDTRTASCLMLSGIELLATINAYNATQPAKIPDEVLAYIAMLEKMIRITSEPYDEKECANFGAFTNWKRHAFDSILDDKPESLK